jgi:hypothetical protein
MKTPTLKLICIVFASIPMLLTATTGMAGDKAKGSAPDWSQQWYIRLIVVSPDDPTLLDRGNVLGHLDDSEAGYDSHDLVELDPFQAPYLTLVFPHPDWAEAGNYASDYHATNAEDADEWVFEVLSDSAYRNILLYWDPLRLVPRGGEPAPGVQGWSNSPQMDTAGELIGRMWLEDTLTGERIPAIDSGSLQSYSFNMEGSNTRSFRWILGDRYGRKPKTAKALKVNGAGYQPDEAVQDSIDSLPPAVGRK